MAWPKGRVGYWKGKHMSDEARENMSRAKKGCPAPKSSFKKGYIMSEEMRANISAGHKGLTPWHAGTKGVIKHGFKKGSGPTSGSFTKDHVGWHHSLETREKMSKSGMGHTVSQESREKMRLKALHRVTKVKNTSIETAIQDGLKALGIPFEQHRYITGTPDLFIEPNICIFADGIYWHTKPRVIKHDKLVNKELTSQGYIVLRFLEGRVKRSIDKVISTICHYIPHANSQNP